MKANFRQFIRDDYSHPEPVTNLNRKYCILYSQTDPARAEYVQKLQQPPARVEYFDRALVEKLKSKIDADFRKKWK
jgi:hypothetical protein